MSWPAALINVYEQSGVKINGKGVIDGDGSMWWDKYWTMRREEYEPKGLRWAVDYDCRRPRLIQVYKSSGVTIAGLTLKRAGFWTVHICYSRDVTADGLTIRNHIGGRGPSTDGVDVDRRRACWSRTAYRVQRRCDLSESRARCRWRVNRPTEKVRIVTTRSAQAPRA
jgi:polygalacturonase